MAESEPSKSSIEADIELHAVGDLVGSSSRSDVLDATMEKLFEPKRSFPFVLDYNDSEPVKQKPFNDYREKSQNFDENDYNSHRSSSFPHIHQTLKGLYSSKSAHSLRLPKKKVRKKKNPSGRSRSFSGRKSLTFTPSLKGVEELNNEADYEEETKRDHVFEEDSDDLADVKDKDEDNEDEEKKIKHDTVDGASTSDNVAKKKDLLPAAFYIGEEEQEDTVDTSRQPLLPRSDSKVSKQSKDSVAAQQFSLATSDVPERSTMFEDVADEPQVSQHAARPMISVPSAEKTKSGPPAVTFNIGGHSDEDLDKAEKHSQPPPSHSEVSKPTSSKGHKRHRRHHHHGEEDLKLRRQKGSEVQMDTMLKRVPTEPEEALYLQDADLDDMSSHRFENVRGIRRHKITPRVALASIVEIGKNKISKKYDHSPHEIFVELDELHLGGKNEIEWREKARWIKFEEDVEEGAERWGKPHVASLSFHSLLELRKGLESGSIILDLEAVTLADIANKVVDIMIIGDQIKEEDRGNVLRTLMHKHKHVNETKALIRRNFSYQNLIGLDSSRGSKPSLLKNFSLASMGSHHSGENNTACDGEVKVDVEGDSKNKMTQLPIEEEVGFINMDDVASQRSNSSQVKEHMKTELDIMKKIPKDAEATVVLVGEVDFLDSPAIAFVRLAEGQMLSGLTEVPLPVRFLFILLGPHITPDTSADYYEIGRSMSTLMSNVRFHEVAYRADDKRELLSAINEFLDESIVLPPGDWERETLLPIMNMARKRNRRRRKQKERERKEREDKEQIEKQKPPMDPLRRTKRCFGGMISEIKQRYPLYLSDLKDALNTLCLAAFFFIYFAALSPAITFGGLLGEKTQQYIGVSETMIGSAMCGALFCLFAGQPILIIGATGPIAVFEESFFSFCQANGMEYLTMRVWIGMWFAVIAIILVALDGSFLIRYVTRFTQEIFASLISLIFIYEVFNKLVSVFMRHPFLPKYPDHYDLPDKNVSAHLLHNANGTAAEGTIPFLLQNNGEINTSYVEVSGGKEMIVPLPGQEPANQPNTALMSFILMFGTFCIAFFLKGFRNSKFLGRGVRRAIGDFGVPIAIFTMVLIDFLIEDVYTTKLNVPDGLSPTNSTKRGWFVNPMGHHKFIQVWQIFAALIPALLVFILVFMESQITGMIVNKKERKLKKGTGYHLDMLIIGVLNCGCSFLGLPFVCAATVRSVAHVSSLTVMSRTHAPGERPQIEEVKEQRMTGFFVNVMVGVSAAMGPILRLIPLSVLFGVFLYMGVASLSGIQMVERIQLLFMPVKHHPDVSFVRKVRTWKMHIFTVIQILCLAVLWVVKSTPAALGVPFVLILMVPLRIFVLKYIFSEQELHELDRDEGSVIPVEEGDSDTEPEEEPDFYTQAHMPL
ncbi:anion exchange protein 2 isoform X2 [Lingula anatina]|uniref:Anion exchange protein n=1 Tax=Lingula anatina TaxID=7574 RepID=A0A1S3HPI3_LINAN|nr:anion exchange protein 2 isoform X2 [Lingula anatina]|eukprot:XP_013387963.1 anion exchange protein 2 isoform X2 [Lingula anatina]